MPPLTNEPSNEPVVSIDFATVQSFITNFLVPYEEGLGTQIAALDGYSGDGPFVLIGNPASLEEAGTLGGTFDGSLAGIYSTLTEYREEALRIIDRIDENMVVFLDLEDDQVLTVAQLTALLGSPSTGDGPNGAIPPPPSLP